MLTVEGDLKHTSVVVDEIKHITTISRVMFISMLTVDGVFDFLCCFS
jgi:hypothetical protein